MRMADLLLELLHVSIEDASPQEDVPELAIVGAWHGLRMTCYGRLAVCKQAFGGGVVALAASYVRATPGGAEAWVSISGGRGNRVGAAIHASIETMKAFVGEEQRPDKAAILETGLLDICFAIVAAFEQRGEEGLVDTNTRKQAASSRLSAFYCLCGYYSHCLAI